MPSKGKFKIERLVKFFKMGNTEQISLFYFIGLPVLFDMVSMWNPNNECLTLDIKNSLYT